MTEVMQVVGHFAFSALPAIAILWALAFSWFETENLAGVWTIGMLLFLALGGVSVGIGSIPGWAASLLGLGISVLASFILSLTVVSNFISR